MLRESIKVKVERTAAVIDSLRRTYPDAHCELDHANPLELLIATILSAQCTDKQVNIVTAELFKKYRNACDYVAVPLEELQNDIRRIGLFRNKGKSIQNCCRSLVDNHGGEVPADMTALVALAGVGRKTANVVLGNAFNINEGVVVDTHVARLSRRLGLASGNTPEKIEVELQKLVQRDHWTMFSHWLIWHGRRRCSARKPECGSCEIAVLCPSEKGGEYRE
ncbi:MAG: endonuclease III [Verrucomicrobiota bacterium]|nr:endonuclease III [Verrucomicrobiales bacterium]MEC9080185.1 endonuclease III [Verrucomicrobiota bacterium]